MELQIAKDYVSKILEIYKNAPHQLFKKIWEYKLSHLKKVDLSHAPEFLKLLNIKQKECYKNALLVCSSISEAKYVEGFIFVNGLPFEHAFNKIGNQYIDVTSEFCLHENVDGKKLISYFEIDGQQAINIALKLGYATSLIQPYLNTKK